jgi:hypothetical protein
MSDELPARVVFVRAGLVWWFLAAAALALNVFFIIAFGLDGGTAGDRVSTGLIGGAIFAGVAAIATATISASNSVIRATGSVRVTDIPTGALAAIDDRNGLTLQFFTGRRLTLGICQSSLAQTLMRNKRRQREADALRSWTTAHQTTDDRVVDRWRREVLILAPVWVGISLALTLLLHALSS